MSETEVLDEPPKSASPLLPQRVRAPRTHGGMLLDPPAAQIADLVQQNVERRRGWDYDVQGRSLADLAAEARRALLHEATKYTAEYREVPRAVSAERVFLAGHQPQLFHAGVWFKNFVLGELAREHNATAVNLVIDSDTVKGASLRVPSGTVETPHVESIKFDDGGEEIPFEDRRVMNPAVLKSFGDRACRAIESLVPAPLLRTFWPLVTQRAAATGNLGAALSQARHQLEGEWGLATLELPQSRVCGLTPFHWFTAHILARLPCFADHYNGAVHEFRSVYHIRSRNHPVPDLATDGGWLEAPFWVWTADSPRRRRLFAQQRNDELLLTNRAGWQFSLPLAADMDASRAVERLAELPGMGVRLRTRALLTTLFARVFLGDLFLHGIGGGKYDELTDLLVRRFFGLTPPRFMVATATLLLPIERPGVSDGELRSIDQRLRELTYHPEQFLAAESGVDGGGTALAEEKRRWVANPPVAATARERCRAIRNANEALQPFVARQRAGLEAERRLLATRRRAETVLASREYAFCLHPAETLRDFLLAFRSNRP